MCGPSPSATPTTTPGAGERELEAWALYNSARNYLRTQIGLSYGLSGHLNVALFGVFTNLHTDARKVRALRFQSRYRIAEPNQWPLDVGALLSYEHPLAAGESGEVGGRLLLEKTLGSVSLASNLIAEKPLVAARPFEFGATLGSAYALSESLKLGAEARYMRIGAGDRVFFGPTASLSLGGTRMVGGVYYGASGAYLGRLIVAQLF